MKMVMAIVSRDEAKLVLEALVAAGHSATFTDSRGGMLRQAQQMLFIATKKEDLEDVLKTIRQSCYSQVDVEPDRTEDPLISQRPPAKADVGGAVVFVWDMERLETY